MAKKKKIKVEKKTRCVSLPKELEKNIIVQARKERLRKAKFITEVMTKYLKWRIEKNGK